METNNDSYAAAKISAFSFRSFCTTERVIES